jgi:di/tricarboxylate transporter
MDFMFWYAVVVLLAMLAAMAFEWLQTEIIITVALFLFILPGTITTGQAFAGFSNEGMLTVAFLYIVASAMEATGVFAILTRWMGGATTGFATPIGYQTNLMVLAREGTGSWTSLRSAPFSTS